SGDANRWGLRSHYLYTDDGVVANWVHVFSPRIVNELTSGIRHSTESFIPSDGVPDRVSRSKLSYSAAQFHPENNTLGTIPRATGWSGIPGSPANINWLDRWGEVGQDYIFSLANNLTVIRGAHSFKAGVYVEGLHNGEARGGNWSGTF